MKNFALIILILLGVQSIVGRKARKNQTDTYRRAVWKGPER
ncbi:hypothetical protein OQZ33_24060 [Pedobacter sp. MC2016-05]|nr:hypothetical protein [Pedobacter sp. MC2016-05]MCX2477425.1 hypothetical protein [Pedobacter sp. MC2016-05]